MIGIFTATMIHARNITSSVKGIDSQVKTMTLEEVSQYDGTDPTKPIYLVYDGNVYDVTAGKEYYVTGGSYHYIAGTDATAELNMFGGEIIKKKYPVIAHVK